MERGKSIEAERKSRQWTSAGTEKARKNDTGKVANQLGARAK